MFCRTNSSIRLQKQFDRKSMLNLTDISRTSQSGSSKRVNCLKLRSIQTSTVSSVITATNEAFAKTSEVFAPSTMTMGWIRSLTLSRETLGHLQLSVTNLISNKPSLTISANNSALLIPSLQPQVCSERKLLRGYKWRGLNNLQMSSVFHLFIALFCT
jgi:hypothetical protein